MKLSTLAFGSLIVFLFCWFSLFGTFLDRVKRVLFRLIRCLFDNRVVVSCFFTWSFHSHICCRCVRWRGLPMIACWCPPVQMALSTNTTCRNCKHWNSLTPWKVSKDPKKWWSRKGKYRDFWCFCKRYQQRGTWFHKEQRSFYNNSTWFPSRMP